MSETVCYYCDRPGFWDPFEEEKLEPLASYSPGAGQDVEFLHPTCYREMMAHEGCGGDDS